MDRFVGMDVGAETLKVVELDCLGPPLKSHLSGGEAVRTARRALVVEHHKLPGPRLLEILGTLGWGEVAGAASTGALGRQVNLPRVPQAQALSAAHRFLHGDDPATIVSIGSHRSLVLELRGVGREVLRRSSRCAQGTGNFLRQLVERFGLSVEEAVELAADAPAAPLSGRCPVILKTDMTHLANAGEGKERILAGLLDAICESVEVLVKPRASPRRVYLCGGVARSSRVRRHFAEFLHRHGMELMPAPAEEGLCLEALGCALVAARAGGPRPPPLSALILSPREHQLQALPALTSALPRVRRLPPPPPFELEGARDVVLGLDIGSTGSKAVALDALARRPLWDGYTRTAGSPVGAAQELVRRFLDSPAGLHRVRGLGVTGSGRELVGSLLATVHAREAIYVLNEIAAHAEGALSLDPRVDTIFEIGGQDAKYIRLAGGRVIDAAMNEACSAGTGSFIEEQGRRFEGVTDAAQLGALALAAPGGVVLGQHCSVFMAEAIDEALAQGVAQDRIMAGLHDAVVANYLDRVKGSRPVGQVIFCQGMPFASDALAAAVARQTGAEVIVPPAPGLMGALGIALLAAGELPLAELPAADLRRFLAARVEGKDQLVCRSTRGCGGAGNRCRIDRLTTVSEGARGRFTWGGSCSLWDAGARRRKLPDRTPDPFRERRELLADLVAALAPRGEARRVVAMTDEFQLKGLLPFFATFVHGLGFDVRISTGATRAALARGVAGANVPFCAPMQMWHGLVAAMAAARPDLLFLPMLRDLPRVAAERVATVCPIAQAAPDLLRWDLGPAAPPILSPILDIGPGQLDSPRFLEGCRSLATSLGVRDERAWRAAWQRARVAQERFDAALSELGESALDACRRGGLTPVVVLGRSYTLHNDVLNSNVPSILREQGAVAIPLDCWPLAPDAPFFEDVYWGHAQRILRAAWDLRRRPDVYAVYCSNYACGPDSITVPLFASLMEGRPFALIETDGHTGDAGTKTRIETFLHCVREARRAGETAVPPGAGALRVAPQRLLELARRRECLLVPSMGPAAAAVAAALCGLGLRAEALPQPTRETLRLGRRHTSGKECLPLTLTLGSLLERIEQPEARRERFTYLVPGAQGPCRLGAYKQLHQLVLRRLGHAARVKIWSPSSGDYFQGLPPGFKAVVFSGLCAAGMLEQALHHVRPAEVRPGAAAAVHAAFTARLLRRLEEAAAGELSAARALLEVGTGRLYGVTELVRQAARELAALELQRDLPTVLLVGEIYVRCEPFANGRAAEALEARGLRTRIAPVAEFVEYADHLQRRRGTPPAPAERLERALRTRIQRLCHDAAGGALGWPRPAAVPEALEAAAPYLRDALEGEAVLTLGGSLAAWRKGEIDAVVSVGPLECMPNKIAEAQLHHAREAEGLPSLTLSLDGDPVDPEVLDGFAFAVRERHRERLSGGRARSGPQDPSGGPDAGELSPAGGARPRSHAPSPGPSAPSRTGSK